MPRGRPRVERIRVSCAVCGTEVEKYLSQVQENKTGRFFCSRKCMRELGPKPKTVPRKKCERCGEEFVSYGKQAGRFCSKECYDAWQRRRQVRKVCEGCGEEFWLKPSQTKNVTGKWCSRTCESGSRIKRPLDREHNGRPAVLDRNGYVRIFEPKHPRAASGWVFEHRAIMEGFVGRHLAQHEHVHHINGKKDDNRLENLIVMDHLEHLALSGSEHRTAIAAMQDELAEYRERYGALEN